MDDDQIQAVVAIIAALAFLALFLVPLVGFFIYAFYQKATRNRAREAALRANQQVIGNNPWFPVRYASERRFKAFFKIFPWEYGGILVMLPGSVLFFGPTLSGQPVAQQFAPGNSTLNWLGKAPWPNGAVSWFYFATSFEKHYFSSETGILIFGSHKSTRAIFEEAYRSFQAPSPNL
ncbi:MAG TPA: hypothetical protein VLL54_08970 [Pyrinomonadaceae bacterium]|nr:hypothetical protein [Pyrinomonadaceae bacterium]